LVDQFIDAFLSTDDVLVDVPKGAEEMYRFFVRTFAGAIFAEQMKDR
jgi:4-hydroxyphenylpyruvate dioxygenase-like putative hemolysin